MARSFNGTSDVGSSTAALNLSAYSVVSLSAWIYNNSYASSYKAAITHEDAGHAQHNCFQIAPSSATGGQAQVFFTDTNATHYWLDGFAPPSAGAWHHWLVVFNRATPSNTVYIDGVLQSLTTVEHDAASYGNFSSSNKLYFAADVNVNFNPCSIAGVGLWGGVALGQADATALAAGRLPGVAHPTGLLDAWRMIGSQSPEPETSGGTSITLTGTARAADPIQLLAVQELAFSATVSPANGTLTATPTPDNILIARVALPANTDSVTSITQTGVTWSKLAQSNSQNDCEIWGGVVGSGASTSIAVVTNVGAIAVAVAEITGYSINQDVTAVLNSSALSTTPATGSITTVGATDLVIAAAASLLNTASATGPTNNFTALLPANSSTTVLVLGGAQQQATAAAWSTAWTVGTTTPWDTVIVALSKLDSFTLILAGTSSLSATVKEFQRFTATIAGTSSLTATVRELQRFTLTLAGTGAITATITEYHRFTATLAGTSTLTATIQELQRFTVTLAGTSSLTASVSEYQRVTVSLAGTSTLAATLQEYQRITVALAGTSSLAATVTPYKIITVALEGTSALTANITEYLGITVEIAGTSSLAATITENQQIVATLAGTSSLTAILTPYQVITLTLAGVGTLAATVTTYQQIISTIAGTSALATAITPYQRITATLAGMSSLHATLTPYQRITTTLAGTSALTIGLTEYKRLTLALAGTSTLTTTLTRYRRLSLTIAGTSTLGATLNKHLAIRPTFTGTSALIAVFAMQPQTPGHGYIIDFNPNGPGGIASDRAVTAGYIRDKRGDE